jgi:hypothetical protein
VVRGAALIGLVAILCAGCGPGSPLWMTESAHKNFLEAIHDDVGRSTADLYFSWNRYRERRGEIKKLPNGNDEYQYFWAGRNYGKCMVYYEVDPKLHKVVAVRFEGTPDTCYLVL